MLVHSSAMKNRKRLQIWNRTRPWVLMQNQQTRELISARKKNITQVQQQRPESPTVTFTWHSCKYKVHKLHQRYILWFMYLVFTCMPGESYHRWLRSLLLFLGYVFWVVVNSLVCWSKKSLACDVFWHFHHTFRSCSWHHSYYRLLATKQKDLL